MNEHEPFVQDYSNPALWSGSTPPARLPSKFQIGDRVTHNSDEWSNKGKPATIEAVTLYGTVHPGLNKPDYALRFDEPSDTGVIATWHVGEDCLSPLEPQA